MFCCPRARNRLMNINVRCAGNTIVPRAATRACVANARVFLTSTLGKCQKFLARRRSREQLLLSLVRIARGCTRDNRPFCRANKDLALRFSYKVAMLVSASAI